MRIVDPILRNFSPPGVMLLRAHQLKLGNRAPEFVSMRVFSVTEASVVLHARMRFVGDDLLAVVRGHMAGGRVFGSAFRCQTCSALLTAFAGVDLLHLPY